MGDRELYITAKKALVNSYSPYSGFRVGAAVLTEDDEIFTGVNVENSSYGASICAERVAFTKAISEGHRKIKAVAIATDNGTAYPCGICRQFMYEFGNDIKVILGKDENDLEIHTLEELLPHGFKL